MATESDATSAHGYGHTAIGTVTDESSVKTTISRLRPQWRMGRRPRAGIIQRPAVRLAHVGRFA